MSRVPSTMLPEEDLKETGTLGELVVIWLNEVAIYLTQTRCSVGGLTTYEEGRLSGGCTEQDAQALGSPSLSEK